MGYCEIVFNLISSTVSPSPPPIAGEGLLNAKESFTVPCKVESKLAPKNEVLPDSKVVIVLAGTLAVAPPPTK